MTQQGTAETALGTRTLLGAESRGGPRCGTSGWRACTWLTTAGEALEVKRLVVKREICSRSKNDSWSKCFMVQPRTRGQRDHREGNALVVRRLELGGAAGEAPVVPPGPAANAPAALKGPPSDRTALPAPPSPPSPARTNARTNACTHASTQRVTLVFDVLDQGSTPPMAKGSGGTQRKRRDQAEAEGHLTRHRPGQKTERASVRNEDRSERVRQGAPHPWRFGLCRPTPPRSRSDLRPTPPCSRFDLPWIEPGDHPLRWGQKPFLGHHGHTRPRQLVVSEGRVNRDVSHMIARKRWAEQAT